MKFILFDAEGNVLKELSGSPEQPKWVAEVEVFKDIPHVARASQHLALMSLSPFTLTDIASKAQKQVRSPEGAQCIPGYTCYPTAPGILQRLYCKR